MVFLREALRRRAAMGYPILWYVFGKRGAEIRISPAGPEGSAANRYKPKKKARGGFLS
jgi:hypothetical protein